MFIVGAGPFLFCTQFRSVVGPTQYPIRWVPGALFQEVKWPGSEADYSSPSVAEVKNDGAVPSLFIAWSLID
jgi:hypothetical protein